MANLLDQTDSEFHEQQRDSPSAIEKLTELLFGKKYLNLPNYFNHDEKPLQRIIPVNSNVEAAKYYKTTSLPANMLPIAAKEFYSNNEVESDEFYLGSKFRIKPYPVRIKPLNKATPSYYPGKNLLKRRLKRELKKPSKPLLNENEF